MSTCISHAGEYSEHDYTGDPPTCDRCDFQLDDALEDVDQPTAAELRHALETLARLEGVLDVVEAALPKLEQLLEDAGPMLEKVTAHPMLKMMGIRL